MAIRGTSAFRSVNELERRIEAYFDALVYEKTESQTRNNQIVSVKTQALRPPTISGLALELDVSRRTLLNYSKKDEFSHVIARARSRIAEWNEEALYSRQTYRAARFMLEVNHGYRKSLKIEKKAFGITTTEVVRPQPNMRSKDPPPRWKESLSNEDSWGDYRGDVPSAQD